jgi:hypothetical protein
MGNIIKTTTARNAACDAITGQLNEGGSPPSHLSIYNADSTRLTHHTLSNPAFGAAVDGTASAYPIADAVVLQDGTASTFVFEDFNGDPVWRGSISLPGHGGALQLENLTLYQDTTVAITSAIYIVPA